MQTQLSNNNTYHEILPAGVHAQIYVYQKVAVSIYPGYPFVPYIQWLFIPKFCAPSWGIQAD